MPTMLAMAIGAGAILHLGNVVNGAIVALLAGGVLNRGQAGIARKKAIGRFKALRMTPLASVVEHGMSAGYLL